MFGAIAGGIASALAGGAMSKLFGGGQKAASGGIQGDVLATDNNTVGMGDAGIKSAIQGSNVPNPDEAVPSFVSGAMAKAGKGLLERSEERFSRNAETDLVCRLLLEKKNTMVTKFEIERADFMAAPEGAELAIWSSILDQSRLPR